MSYGIRFALIAVAYRGLWTKDDFGNLTIPVPFGGVIVRKAYFPGTSHAVCCRVLPSAETMPRCDLHSSPSLIARASLGSRRHSGAMLLLTLTFCISACSPQVRGGHTTQVPGFFAYYHEELRAHLRAQGQSDRLVDNPSSAVRRSGDHAAIILLTQSDSDSKVQAHILSGGKIAKLLALNSDSVEFDMSYRPVLLPRSDGPVVDRCGRYYSVLRNAPAEICRVDRPGAVLARAPILVHDVFSSEDRVFVVGAGSHADTRCLIYQVSPSGLGLMKEVEFPVRGGPGYGGLVTVVDMDEKRGLAVIRSLAEFDARSNECYLLDLNTSNCRNIGRMTGDFGFFLDRDVLPEPRRR